MQAQPDQGKIVVVRNDDLCMSCLVSCERVCVCACVCVCVRACLCTFSAGCIVSVYSSTCAGIVGVHVHSCHRYLLTVPRLVVT